MKNIFLQKREADKNRVTKMEQNFKASYFLMVVFYNPLKLLTLKKNINL
jgi:hypothetical protein